MKSIVVEGPDCVGKTTAIQGLKFILNDKYGVDDSQTCGRIPEVRHLSRDDVIGIKDEAEAFSFFAGRVSDTYIWDRFHLGSYIYGYKCNLHETWIEGEAPFARLCRLIAPTVFTIVIYDSSDEDYYSRLTSSGREEMFNIDQCMHVNAAYRRLQRYDIQDEVGVIQPVDLFHDINYIGYPISAQLEYWVEEAKKYGIPT